MSGFVGDVGLDVGPVAIAGRYIAFAVSRYPESPQDPPGYSGVRLVDALLGRFRKTGPTGAPIATTVSAVAVDVTGRVAWISRTSRTIQVKAHDRCGNHTLANGVESTVDTSYLRLTGGRAIWKSGGQQQRRNLCA